MLRTASRAGLLAAVFALAACSDDDATGTTPIDPSVLESTVSSEGASYVSLADGPTRVTVADPATSTAWDLSLSTLTVNTNVAAGVRVHCLCGNANASNADLQTFTAANQLAAFNAVTAASIPSDEAFSPDLFAPAISGWYTGTGAEATAVPTRLIVLRRGASSFTFVKARVTGITGAAANGPASVTLEYAAQPAPGAPFGAVQTLTLANGASFDFGTGAAGSGTAFDLKLDGWNLVLNSGVTGPGSTVGISFPENPAQGQTFAALPSQAAAMIQATTFRRDGLASVFGNQPWYKYNITGTDLQVWPTFNVYLVQRGSAVWKVQLTGYYDLTGAPRNITIRSARLR
jgi:hypothetical protein